MTADDRWESGEPYERYIGRWSRRVAAEFVTWLEIEPGRRWLDVGCGTGALSETILDLGAPSLVAGVDPSAGFVGFASARLGDRAQMRVADARALPFADGIFDVAVSGLVLNFVPEPDRAACEMARVTRTGGVVGAYVWDYAGEMQLIRHFFDAAVALDPTARELDEGTRFPLCEPEALQGLFERAGLTHVRVRAIDVDTHFADFDDYWTPFLGGQGPAPAYAMSLSEERRAALRERIRERLPTNGDGSIDLVARAWAARGSR